jgi:hypothetical protein
MLDAGVTAWQNKREGMPGMVRNRARKPWRQTFVKAAKTVKPRELEGDKKGGVQA